MKIITLIYTKKITRKIIKIDIFEASSESQNSWHCKSIDILSHSE